MQGASLATPPKQPLLIHKGKGTAVNVLLEVSVQVLYTPQTQRVKEGTAPARAAARAPSPSGTSKRDAVFDKFADLR
eukprot:CAMPEP_0171155522 /NCGR_PEP_ID=MMETSP0790-20130122/944_1 /TAXON_ID=2925 /ORGANISM="Alexandrium catenella, Strain OF101" /LENGTH=76 /DNA_ID=CAMNT_0011619745 /DNA_START=285 /DNA_END=511 /DNA_ORIENTATION=-